MTDRVEVHEHGNGTGNDNGAGWFMAMLLVVVLLVVLFVYYRPDTTSTEPTKQETSQPVNLDIETNTTVPEQTTPPAAEDQTPTEQQPTQ